MRQVRVEKGEHTLPSSSFPCCQHVALLNPAWAAQRWVFMQVTPVSVVLYSLYIEINAI